jgi:hypothetical protein
MTLKWWYITEVANGVIEETLSIHQKEVPRLNYIDITKNIHNRNWENGYGDNAEIKDNEKNVD